MADTPLKQARQRANLKADAVIRRIIELAQRFDIAPMSETSLKTNLSRWENGRQQVSAKYRPLFREIYGRTNEELGFPPDEEEEDDEHAELLSRIHRASSVDPPMVEALRHEIDAMRYPDRKLGGARLFDRLNSTVENARELLTFDAALNTRAPLAGALTEASTLAGWLALSRNAVSQAWDHYERAKYAAGVAEDHALLAHATAEQAFVLIDIGETIMAVRQLEYARELAAGRVSPVLAAWLTAAHGEGLAATGHAGPAIRAFDQATALLPTDPRDPQLPFLFLGQSHLERWRGNALVRVGNTESVETLGAALEQLPDEFGRARVGVLVDLATGYAAAGDRAAAQYYQNQARRLGRQINAERHLRRLSRLTLPL